MIYRFLFFFALCASLVPVGVAAAKKNVEPPNAVNYEPLNSDIGPAPAIDVNDYKRYRLSVPGNAELFGDDLTITLTNESKFSCRVDELWLYPDTPYTRWMVDKWALDADGRHGFEAPLYPGTDPRHLAPSWLQINYTSSDPNSVVRYTGCDKGFFSFKNVPVGMYIMVGSIVHYGGSYSTTESSGESTTVDSPAGPVLVDGGSHIVGGGFQPSDDFIVISRSPIVVSAANKFYKFMPAGMKVIARRFER